jgi:hypothetical protein
MCTATVAITTDRVEQNLLRSMLRARAVLAILM